MTRENDVFLIYEQRIGKSKLLDALLQPADLLCRMSSDVVRMTLQSPHIFECKLTRVHERLRIEITGLPFLIDRRLCPTKKTAVPLWLKCGASLTQRPSCGDPETCECPPHQAFYGLWAVAHVLAEASPKHP